MLRNVVLAWVAVLSTVSALGIASRSDSSGPPARKAKASRADKHAFPRTFSFYKCGPEEEIARRDMIVALGYCRIGDLRRLNPKGVFLLHAGLFPSGAAEYGGMHITYGGGLWFWRRGYSWKDGGCDHLAGGVNLGCMREFDFDWDYMHNADGSIAGIDNGTGGHRGWNIADPVAKGTRELVAKFMAYTAKVSGIYARGWDGLFSDNWIYGVIGESHVYGPNLDTDRDGKVDDYRVLRRQWDDGLNEIGNRIRSYLPGKSVLGNGNWFAVQRYYGSDPTGWLKSANATMVEGAERYYDSSAELLKIAERWLTYPDPRALPRYIVFLQNALTRDGERLRVAADTDPNTPKYMLDQGVMRSMRWGFTLALMAGGYYEIHLNGNHSTRWWYDEYDGGEGVRRRGYLGHALGRPVMLRAGVWRREFEHGVALNNSTTKVVAVKLKEPHRRLRGPQNPRLNDGRVVSKVMLPPHDGLILIKVKQKKK